MADPIVTRTSFNLFWALSPRMRFPLLIGAVTALWMIPMYRAVAFCIWASHHDSPLGFGDCDWVLSQWILGLYALSCAIGLVGVALHARPGNFLFLIPALASAIAAVCNLIEKPEVTLVLRPRDVPFNAAILTLGSLFLAVAGTSIASGI